MACFRIVRSEEMEPQESAGEMLGAFCLRRRRPGVPKKNAQQYLGGIKTHSHLVEKSQPTVSCECCVLTIGGDGDTVVGIDTSSKRIQKENVCLQGELGTTEKRTTAMERL